MMTDWFQKSIDALNLNAKPERPPDAYPRALRMLCESLPSQLRTERARRGTVISAPSRGTKQSSTRSLCVCRSRERGRRSSSSTVTGTPERALAMSPR